MVTGSKFQGSHQSWVVTRTSPNNKEWSNNNCAVDGTIVVDDYAIEGPGPSWCRFGKAKDIILKIRYDDEPIIFRNTRFNNFSDIINRLSSMLAVYEENVNHQPKIKVLNQRIESPVIYDGKMTQKYAQNFEFTKTILLNAGMRPGDAFLDVGAFMSHGRRE